MTPELVQKYAAPVPRYTSYPTAPHFTSDVDGETYGDWLEQLPDHEALSLYVHIPFCDTLCWYCGCSTKMVKRYDPVARYLPSLLAEVKAVGARVPDGHAVTHIAWGGGSPNVLTPDDILKLGDALRQRFHIGDDAEFAVEIDPRRFDPERASAFARTGVTRVSIGVQDFAQKVQDAINRQQSFEVTKSAVDKFRDAGVASVNLDLVYGLPHQTRDSARATMEMALRLKPDRIALFGYAHLPARLPHQRLIDDDALPGMMQRFEQSSALASYLLDAGYVRVGLDHFALPHDALASGTVARNFQGYTTDDADTLIGLGASSIGKLPQGYVQNAVPVDDYGRRISDSGLATVRGRALSDDDRARAFVIEQLMCGLNFPAGQITDRFASVAAPILEEAGRLIEDDVDGLIQKTDDGFRITEMGRPFVRTICSRFDAYLATSTARHSSGV